jgi:hypothetical protein
LTAQVRIAPKAIKTRLMTIPIERDLPRLKQLEPQVQVAKIATRLVLPLPLRSSLACLVNRPYTGK